MPPPELTRLQRLAYGVWLAVGVVLLAAVTLYVLARPLAVIVPPLLVAIILIYLLNPIVSGLHRIRIPRLLGTLVAFALFIGGVIGVGSLLVPMLFDQITKFAEVAPEFGVELTERFNDWMLGLGIELDLDREFDPEVAAQQVQEYLADADVRSALMALVGGLGGLFAGVFNLGVALVAGPFIAAYLLVDMPRVQAWAYRAVPAHHREELAQVGRRLSEVLGGFIRGQLVVATYVGVATSVGLAIIGLPFWLILGVVAGITNLVPLIGPFIAGLLGVLVALFTDGVGLAVAVVVVVTIVQQGDNQIVSPLVMGRTVRLHPLVVLLALLVGGMLYGIFGLLIAVPVVAAANVVLAHFWNTRVPWADDTENLPVRGRRGARRLSGRRASRSEASGQRAPADKAQAERAEQPSEGPEEPSEGAEEPSEGAEEPSEGAATRSVGSGS